MSKQELAALIRKIEAMQRELAEIVSRLRFIPVSSSSSSDDDEEYNPGMKK